MSENDKGEGGASVPPIHWTVEAVVSWLREVGFDEDVCDKFEHQRISGMELLALDITLLKSEIGIETFGLRVRIKNAIDKLRPAAPSTAPFNKFTLPVAQALHDKLWGQSLDTIFEDVPDNSRKNMKYVSTEHAKELRLGFMYYPGDALLVREEYHHALEVLTVRAEGRSRGGGVVVTGQPGIGKSCFLFYILFFRLSEGLPTALQTSDDWFFNFTGTGATVHPVASASFIHLTHGTWALTDSNARVTAPCSAFLEASRSSHVWVVQATSPMKSRWYEWSKQHSASIYVMDWFPSNELAALSKILNLELDHLLRHYKTWGPSARTCIDLERGIKTAKLLTATATSAAKSLVSDPHAMLSSIAELDPSKVSHVLFALRPQSPEERDVPCAELATSHLQGFVIRAIAELELVRQSEFFALISNHPWFKGSAGNVYEKFVHVRLIAHPSAEPLIGIPADSKLPQLVIPVCTQHIPLGGLSRLTTANEYKLPFYWRPTNQSFTSVNSILCTERAGIFIKSTVSPKHDAKPGGIQSVHDSLPKGFWRKRKWAFVFITDTDENAVALRSQELTDLPGGIDVYSCTFKIGQSKLTSRELAVLEEVTGAESEVQKPEGLGIAEAQVPEKEAPDPKQETFAEGSNPKRPLQVEEDRNQSNAKKRKRVQINPSKLKKSPKSTKNPKPKRHNPPRTVVQKGKGKMIEGEDEESDHVKGEGEDDDDEYTPNVHMH